MVRAQDVRRSSILLSLADAEDHVGPTSECADTPSPRTAEYTPPMTSLCLSLCVFSLIHVHVHVCQSVFQSACKCILYIYMYMCLLCLLTGRQSINFAKFVVS